VEARYGGKTRWYGAKVMREREDGTYDLLYDDGDKEMRVRAELIRSKDGVVGGASAQASSSGGGRSGGFREGDRVEARYGGKTRWYGAKVMREREDGTYDLLYDDGDKEMRVRAELIRSKDGVAPGRPSHRPDGPSGATRPGTRSYVSASSRPSSPSGGYDRDRGVTSFRAEQPSSAARPSSSRPNPNVRGSDMHK